MKPISLDYARRLIDFAGSGGNRSESLAELQLAATVAAHNMLARNRVAYLADEVGMGKTYIALGVMGLLRYANPRARIMVIAPRENIQRKWLKELHNFVRCNWLVVGNRVKSIQNTPSRAAVPVHGAAELAAAAVLCDTQDLYLRMTSFSLATRNAEDRRRHRDRLLAAVPALDRRLLQTNDPEEFQALFGAALNFVLPELDLLVIDEAHNLKHGFGPHASTRNRVMAYTFGGAPEPPPDCPWYAGKVKHLLMLSATPFEYDYADIARQTSVFGLMDQKVARADGQDPRPIRQLLDPALSEDSKRELVARLLIRRVFELQVADRRLTKNMYRREWRGGGYKRFDDPLSLTDVRQRLIVALMQKKVTELLGDKRFNNHYQIGMLSCFESFMETVAHRRKPASGNGKGSAPNGETADEERVFDGDQDATADERLGIESHALATIGRSYRRKFGSGLPHPKLDATADALATAFGTGEKALVFVRRVATVAELKDKLDLIFNAWLRAKVDANLPELREEVAELFAQYAQERAGARPSTAVDSAPVEDAARIVYGDDEGGTDTFFAWFFRGDGPPGVLSGAAFQKNRLASDSSAYSTLFEDDHVAWLLGRPVDVLSELAARLRVSREHLQERLRGRSFARFRARTKRQKGYPRFYVFEAYQIAALELLAELPDELGQRAKNVLAERYEVSGPETETPPTQFPGPEAGLGVTTFITELVKNREVRVAIWPDDGGADFRARFRRREQRRELLSAMCRLGASFIDLYLLAIGQLGSFDLAERGGRSAEEHPEMTLARGFAELLAGQRQEPGFNAFRELSQTAAAFDTLVAANFHQVQSAALSDLAEIFGRALQHQVPVAGMAGGVNKRIVAQFRMPGFPLVLVTTEVLQEGEDLHTFCRRVIHYGIAWTPSALEQRTGRVDRIGSLLQRTLEGRSALPADEDFIQVHYPHLLDTVEVLQVRRVLERLNTFLRLIHRVLPEKKRTDSQVDVSHEILRPATDVAQIREPLQSAFPIHEGWLVGETPSIPAGVDIAGLESHLAAVWSQLVATYGVRDLPTRNRRTCSGVFLLKGGRVLCAEEAAAVDNPRTQGLRLELRSQPHSDATLLHCASWVGLLDLDDDVVLDRLYDLHQELGLPKICARFDPRRREYHVSVEGDLLFTPDKLPAAEIKQLVLGILQIADRIEYELLGRDDDINGLQPEEVADAARD